MLGKNSASVEIETQTGVGSILDEVQPGLGVNQPLNVWRKASGPPRVYEAKPQLLKHEVKHIEP